MSGAWLLGILAGVGVLFYVTQRNGSEAMLEKRRLVKFPEQYYQVYKENLDNPLFIKNRMQDEAYVTRTSDGSTGTPRYLVHHAGHKFTIDRMPLST
jgi:hypothetical protein